MRGLYNAKLTSLVKWCFNFAFNNLKNWSPLSPRYGIFIHIVSKSLLAVLFILFTFRYLSLLLIIASRILLAKSFYTIRSFIGVSSAFNLFLSQILTMFCRAMRNNCYNECIALYLCLCNKYLSHLDEFQYQENGKTNYLIYQQRSSSSCQSCLKHHEQVLSVLVLLQLMSSRHNANKIIKSFHQKTSL